MEKSKPAYDRARGHQTHGDTIWNLSSFPRLPCQEGAEAREPGSRAPGFCSSACCEGSPASVREMAKLHTEGTL